MNPITHFLAGWTVADSVGLERRDHGLVTWAGLLPDADGLGVVVDFANRLLGRPDSSLYGLYHHSLLHGLFAAVAIPAALSLAAERRLRMFLWGLAAVHLHLLCDLVGSGGPGAEDIWPIPYLAPFSERLAFSWSGQWALNAWPNVVLTLVLLASVFVKAVTRGYSPLGLLHDGADRAFVATVRARWSSLGGRGGQR